MLRNIGIGWGELIVLLVLVLLIFGVGRISKIAGELGSGIRSFKEGLSGKKEDGKEKDVEETSDKADS